MSAQQPRTRKPADPAVRRSVKTSLTVDADLHARWSAAASLRGLDRNAFAAEALRIACKHIVIHDRSRPKSAAHVALSDEAIGEIGGDVAA